MSSPQIALMTKDHAREVLLIYQEGLESGHASFEARCPKWPGFDNRFLEAPRLVAKDSKNPSSLLGFGCLSQVSSRPAYEGVAEVTVYVSARARGKGLGKRLLGALIEASEKLGFWTLQASIFPENIPSVQCHASQGFETVGRRRRLGLMTYGPFENQWRDVLLLERRSQRVGVSSFPIR